MENTQTFGCCTLAFIPLRASASHRSEMVSQLLFGESYRIISADGDWLEVDFEQVGPESFRNIHLTGPAEFVETK